MKYKSHRLYEIGTETNRRSVAIKNVIFEGQTQFQQVGIFDTYEYGKMLIVDGQAQSAETDEYRYHESLVQPAMTAHPEPHRVLIIGGGEGAAAREVLYHSSVMKVIMVDIDGQLVQKCKEHLWEWHKGAFEDPRLHLLVGDGQAFVKDCKQKFDVIIIDLCDQLQTQAGNTDLLSPLFYQQVKRLLTRNGILVIQGMEANGTGNNKQLRIYKELVHLFNYASPYAIFVPSFSSEWGFLIASDRINVADLGRQDIDERLRHRDIARKLGFYDGNSHQCLFSMTKDRAGAFQKIAEQYALHKPRQAITADQLIALHDLEACQLS